MTDHNLSFINTFGLGISKLLPGFGLNLGINQAELSGYTLSPGCDVRTMGRLRGSASLQKAVGAPRPPPRPSPLETARRCPDAVPTTGSAHPPRGETRLRAHAAGAARHPAEAAGRGGGGGPDRAGVRPGPGGGGPRVAHPGAARGGPHRGPGRGWGGGRGSAVGSGSSPPITFPSFPNLIFI